MAETKLTNMINPEVMADMISAQLPAALKFAPLAEIDSTLVGQAGDTITVPVFSYIGAAEDLTEGVAMDTTVLTASTDTFTIKESGKSVELTEKALNSGYGDIQGETEKQLLLSINDKIDNDCLTALSGGTLEYDVTGTDISYATIVGAIDLFAEEDDEMKYLYIHPEQKTQLRLDENFTKASDMGDSVTMTGVIGEIAGCQVVTSSKIDKAVGGEFTNIIVKPGALAIYLKADTNIKTAEDILKRTLVVAANKHYAPGLKNDSKVVRLITSGTA